jgi:hypothetical protein
VKQRRCGKGAVLCVRQRLSAFASACLSAVVGTHEPQSHRRVLWTGACAAVPQVGSTRAANGSRRCVGSAANGEVVEVGEVGECGGARARLGVWSWWLTR